MLSIRVLLNIVRLSPSCSGHASLVLAQGGLAVGLGPLEELALPRRHVLAGPGLQTRGLESATK